MTASEAEHGGPNQRYGRGNLGLPAAVLLWQTPNVPNGGRVNPMEMSPTGIMPDGTKRQVGLEHQVKMVERGLWPTPTVNGNSNREGASKKSGDGNWWAAEPDVGRVAHGVSTALDVFMRGGRLIENLSILRCCSCSESMARRQGHEGDDVPVSEILQFEMLRKCDTCKKRLLEKIRKKAGAEALSDNAAVEVRNLRSFWGKAEPPSCGRRYTEQRTAEHRDMLLELPQRDGYGERKMGAQCSRVERLKCLGNAVVPAQFAPIFAAIAEIERMDETC